MTTEPCPLDASKNIYVTTITYNYSWQEIYDALNADTPVFLVDKKSGDARWHLVSDAYLDDDVYDIMLDDGSALHFGSPTAKTRVLRDTTACGGVQ